jgi:hypothetical protein
MVGINSACQRFTFENNGPGYRYLSATGYLECAATDRIRDRYSLGRWNSGKKKP